MMFNDLAYMMILGLPAITWGGIAALLILALAAAMPTLTKKKIWVTTVKQHRLVGIIAVILGLGHGLLGILLRF